VFAAALWAADYMLELASLGYAGVNLHGGDGQLVANSVGGKLPGDDMVKDDPASHPHPYYTPIAHIGDRYIAEPVSYGMRFAQHFAGSKLMQIKLEENGSNVSVYAAKTPKAFLVGVINKDSRPFQLPAFEPATTPTELEVTSAPSLTSTDVKISMNKPQGSSAHTIPPATMVLFTYSSRRS
jgi:hypothetical protein